MKKVFLVIISIFIILRFAGAQVLCVSCYQQNDSISQHVHNLVLNGGFENTNCIPNQYNSSFCPKSQYYSCTVANWICTGGGSKTYVSVDNSGFVKTADGTKAVYLGDAQGLESACSPQIGDTSCFRDSGCVTVGIPAGYPATDTAYGGATGVSIEQTVNGLTVGSIYVLEFWAGGEPQTNGWRLPGLFAVDIGFGNIFLRCNPTDPSSVGTRYLIQFKATSTSHTIKFTNWGHVGPYCTEIVVDNVRLYPLADLSPSVLPCTADVLPLADFTASDTTICANDCINYTDLSMNANSWQWNFPGAQPSSSTDRNPQNICYLSPGNYGATLIATGTGGSDSLTITNYINVKVAPPPPIVTQLNDSVLTCTTDSTYISYQWFDSTMLIPIATDTFVVIHHSGNYNVQVTNSNGCKTATGINITGLKNYVSDRVISLYPDPVQNQFTIHHLPFIIGTIVIYNVLGEVCQQSQIINLTSEIKMDVSFLPPGIYIVKLVSEKGSMLGRFVKE